jgi:hypothetical protein
LYRALDMEDEMIIVIMRGKAAANTWIKFHFSVKEISSKETILEVTNDDNWTLGVMAWTTAIDSKYMFLELIFLSR